MGGVLGGREGDALRQRRFWPPGRRMVVPRMHPAGWGSVGAKSAGGLALTIPVGAGSTEVDAS